jgi:hypothetical protein
MISIPNELRVPPPAKYGGRIDVSFEADQVAIRLTSGGLFKSPPALKLVAIGSVLLAGALYIFGTNVLMAFREGLNSAGGLMLQITPLLTGLLIFWLASVPLLSAFRSTRCSVITITDAGLVLSHAGAKAPLELPWNDSRSLLITDVMKLAFELIVITPAHRVIQLAAGRGVDELTWIAQVIEACRPQKLNTEH